MHEVAMHEVQFVKSLLDTFPKNKNFVDVTGTAFFHTKFLTWYIASVFVVCASMLRHVWAPGCSQSICGRKFDTVISSQFSFTTFCSIVSSKPELLCSRIAEDLLVLRFKEPSRYWDLTPVITTTLPSSSEILCTRPSGLPASSHTPMLTIFILLSSRNATAFSLASYTTVSETSLTSPRTSKYKLLLVMPEIVSKENSGFNICGTSVTATGFKLELFKATTVLIGAEMYSGLAFWSKATFERNQVVPSGNFCDAASTSCGLPRHVATQYDVWHFPSKRHRKYWPSVFTPDFTNSYFSMNGFKTLTGKVPILALAAFKPASPWQQSADYRITLNWACSRLRNLLQSHWWCRLSDLQHVGFQIVAKKRITQSQNGQKIGPKWTKDWPKITHSMIRPWMQSTPTMFGVRPATCWFAASSSCVVH